MERVWLDNLINRTILKKRVLGRPLKPLYQTKKQWVGYLQYVYNPKTPL